MISTHLILCQRVLWVVHHLLHPCLHPVWIIFYLFSSKTEPQSEIIFWMEVASFISENRRESPCQLRSREQYNPLNELPSHLHTFALHQFWATELQSFKQMHTRPPTHSSPFFSFLFVLALPPVSAIFFFSFFTRPPSLYQFCQKYRDIFAAPKELLNLPSLKVTVEKVWN